MSQRKMSFQRAYPIPIVYKHKKNKTKKNTSPDLTGLYSSMRSSCSGVHLSSTGSRISNGTPPVSYSTEGTFQHKHSPHRNARTRDGRRHSLSMLFWRARMHCWYKLIMLGRKALLFPEYTCIFLLQRWPVKCFSPASSNDSFSTVKKNK